MSEYKTLIAPEFSWVLLPSVRKLAEGEAESLEHTLELAHKRVDQAAAAVIRELNRSSSQANPETLAELIREVRRRREVVADIAGLQVALSGCGKS